MKNKLRLSRVRLEIKKLRAQKERGAGSWETPLNDSEILRVERAKLRAQERMGWPLGN